MTYLIAGALFVLIIALIIALRAPKKKKPEVIPEQVDATPEVAESEVKAEGEVESSADIAAAVDTVEEKGEAVEEEAADAERVDEEPSVDEEFAGVEDEELTATYDEEKEQAEIVDDEPAEAEVEESNEESVETDTVAEETLPEPEVAVEEEQPAELTRESYAAHLENLEDKIRQELAWAIENQETVKRTLLEPRLLVVCEMKAAVDANFNRLQEVIADTEKVLDQVHGKLPGFDCTTAKKQLDRGEFEVVEAVLSEASSQLDDQAGLAAEVYKARGRLAEELLDYFAAYENYRKAYAADADNQEYLLSAGRMARITGNDQDAQFWLEKLVRVGIEKGEKTHAQSIAQHELGMVCARTDQKEKAGALFKRSIEVKEQVLGSDHQELGPVMHDYAVLFEGNGMYDQAEDLYKKSIAVTEKEFGEVYPRLGSTLNKLAGLYEEMELAEQSEPLYIRALALKEKVLGAEHLDVGTILNNLAELMRRQGRHEEAEPLFLRSLDISEKELGPEHPNLTIVLNNLAELYTAMGREDEAARYQERAFALFELPGAGGDFVEMEKEEDFDIDDDKDQSVT